MKIAVIGTGYVGLVAGACFADSGNQVICVDIDPKKIDRLKRGEIPIYEPGLDTLVLRGVDQERLSFTTSTRDAVQASDIIFLAVGTPPLPNGEPNLSYLQAASEEIGRSMNGRKIVVNKSTVPIGSHKTVAHWIQGHSSHPVDVVSNPEFLKEGSALEDFLKPDRVVIGTTDESVYQRMAELYAPFVRQGNPVLWMDPVSAEITKYACNSFLATRISFMNELSQLCEKLGGDVEEIRKGMATDVRIGRHFLYAGAGYGGSCFPKDVQALMATARRAEVPMEIVTAAENANARQKRHLASKVLKQMGSNLAGKKIAVWGLAFKPNTDDMREAPALTVIPELVKAGAKVVAFDPVAMEHARELLGSGVEFADSSMAAIQGADALVLITEWNEFRHVDFDQIASQMKGRWIFDGRNIWNPKAVRQKGFQYSGMGRP